MVSASLNERFTEEVIELGKICLDPSNPRLIGVDNYFGVPEDRISEPEIQERTLARLNAIRAIDQDSLRASIQQSGLLPVDRIVVRPVPGHDDLFVVVEGNRRIAACKTLLQQHKSGERTLTPEVLSTIEKPTVLVLHDADPEAARLDQWVIQGVRHISGIRPWGAYQAAKTIEAMLEKLGYSESDVASALSISVQRVRRSMRVLAAIRQMSESDDYAEYATAEYYAYFDELLKRPVIRQWLGWSNDLMSFENDDRLEMLYSWITPDDELDGRRRIPVAEGLRRVDIVLEDPAALEVLNTPGNTIEDAARIAAPLSTPDWTEPLTRAIKALDAVPIGDLESLSDENQQTMETLLALIQKRLEQAAKFKA